MFQPVREGCQADQGGYLMGSATSAAPKRAGDKWVVLFMLLITGVLLALIIFLGWQRLIQPYTTNFATAISTMITVLAALVAYHIGVQWYKEAFEAQEEDRPQSYRWLLSYPAFFFISALGVINVAFYYLEGTAVLRQNMDEAEQAFTGLNTAAQAELRDTGHQIKIDRVHQLLDTLTNEIDNPNGAGHCGVGPVARDTIAKIHTILPAFQEFSGSRASLVDCGRAPALAQRYREEADQLLQSDPDFDRVGGPERQRFTAKLAADHSNAHAQFDHARHLLDTSALLQRGDAYGAAKTSLETVSISYADDRLQFDKLAGQSHDTLPLTLDLRASRDLGSFVTILSSLFRRATFFSTWFYIFLAIALDFAVLALVKNVQSEFAPAGRRSRWQDGNTPRRIQTEKGGGPRFLWVNPD
jgi:hypothetical protein